MPSAVSAPPSPTGTPTAREDELPWPTRNWQRLPGPLRILSLKARATPTPRERRGAPVPHRETLTRCRSVSHRIRPALKQRRARRTTLPHSRRNRAEERSLASSGRANPSRSMAAVGTRFGVRHVCPAQMASGRIRPAASGQEPAPSHMCRPPALPPLSAPERGPGVRFCGGSGVRFPLMPPAGA